MPRERRVAPFALRAVGGGPLWLWSHPRTPFIDGRLTPCEGELSGTFEHECLLPSDLQGLKNNSPPAPTGWAGGGPEEPKGRLSVGPGCTGVARQRRITQKDCAARTVGYVSLVVGSDRSIPKNRGYTSIGWLVITDSCGEGPPCPLRVTPRLEEG